MKDVEIIGMLKSYVQKSLVGVGALKGAPCKIQSITDGDGFHTVKFEWTDDAGTSHTSDMIVNDGSDIASITQDGTTITVELSDGTSHDFIVPTVQGPKGDKGDKGDTGVGVPEGGTAGQVLVKKSSTDYDTEWDTPEGGGDMLKSVYDTDNDGKVDSAENADTVDGHTVAKDVPADAKFTDTVYDDTEIRGEIPSKTSDLTNDSGFITKAVNDLVNYYLKSETYSKTEVDDIVTAIKNSRFEVVATLPTTDIKTNVIYLVPKDPAQTSNVKDEYINLDGTTAGWEKIGDTEIDLSNYVTTQALNTALADYTTTADLTTLLAGKQDTLTFDDVPTENSTNPVQSGGVYSAETNIYAEMTRQGVKNILSQQFDEVMITASLGNKATSANGLTLTYNSDGSIKIDGTPTDSSKNIAIRFDWDSNNHPFDISYLAGKKIVASISETEINGIMIIPGYFDASDGAHQYSGADITTKGEYTYPNDVKWARCYMSISGAYSYSNVTVYPMIYIPFEGATDDYAPPTMTNVELTAENQTLKQALSDEVATRSALGAHNLFGVGNSLNEWFAALNDGKLPTNYIASDTITGTVDKDTNSIVITGYDNTGYRWGCKKINLKKNTRYTFSRTSCNGTIQLFGKNNADDRAVVVSGLSNGGTVNSGDYDWWYIGFYPSRTGGYFSITDLLVRLETDADPTYRPYVPTNAELLSYKDNGVLGAKNFLWYDVDNIKNENTSGTWTGNVYTINGGIFTFNDDGSVVLNGTLSEDTEIRLFYRYGTKRYRILDGNYKLVMVTSANDGKIYATLGCTRSNSFYTYARLTSSGEALFTVSSTDEDSGFSITALKNTAFSNVTIKTMILLPSDSDYTQVPYAKTNQQLTQDTTSLLDNLEVNGAVNMLPNNATTQTINGVTFTVNSDGTVTANGTATANAVLKISDRFTLADYIGRKYVDAKKNEASSSTYSLIITYRDGSGVYVNETYVPTEGFILSTISNATLVEFGVFVKSGQTVSNLTFKPMITVPSYNGDYVPYAKSNKELTEELTNYLVQKNYNFVASDLSEKQNGAASFNAGAIGTKGCRCTWDISDEINSGLVPISSVIIDFFDSNLYFSQTSIDISNKIIKLDIYRCTTNAVSDARTQIRITYAKKNFMTT